MRKLCKLLLDQPLLPPTFAKAHGGMVWEELVFESFWGASPIFTPKYNWPVQKGYGEISLKYAGRQRCKITANNLLLTAVAQSLKAVVKVTWVIWCVSPTVWLDLGMVMNRYLCIVLCTHNCHYKACA